MGVVADSVAGQHAKKKRAGAQARGTPRHTNRWFAFPESARLTTERNVAKLAASEASCPRDSCLAAVIVILFGLKISRIWLIFVCSLARVHLPGSSVDRKKLPKLPRTLIR
jgi:hypothetical protein